MYLLEQTVEASEMRQKVRDLLFSKDEKNYQLAFQLIEGGGLHESFVAPLWGLYFHYTPLILDIDEENEELSMGQMIMDKFLSKILQEDALSLIQDPFHHDEYLEGIQNTPSLHNIWRDIVFCILFYTKWGGKFCIEHKASSMTQILACLVENDTLNLSGLGLENLPTEIASINAHVLILSDNPLRLMQASTWKNPHIKMIRIEAYISYAQMKILAFHFPNAKAKTFRFLGDFVKRLGHQAQRANDMETAKKSSLKAICFYRFVPKEARDADYYHARAHAYNNAGKYKMAEICYKHINTHFAQNISFDLLYNMTCNYARLQNKAKTIEFLQKYIASFPFSKIGIRSDILSDNDFEIYYKDEDFLNVLSTISIT